MVLQRVKKDPNAVIDYTVDWGDWLASGETISVSAWTVPTGITEDASSNTSTTATIRLTGGTAGENYDIANKITTSGGEIDERTFTVIMAER
jgi:hypothetical protein